MHGAYPSKTVGQRTHQRGVSGLVIGQVGVRADMFHLQQHRPVAGQRHRLAEANSPVGVLARLAGGDAGVCCAVAALGGARPRGGAPVATGHAGQRAGIAGGVGQPQFFTLVIIVGAAGLVLAQAQLGAQQVAGGQLPAQLQAQIVVRATQLLGGRQIYPIAVVIVAVFVVGAGQGFFVELVFRFQAQATVVQIAMPTLPGFLYRLTRQRLSSAV